MIYLDHNATTPVDPRVLEAMLPYFSEVFGNAASVDHEYGYQAKQAVEKAREQVANAINAYPDEIIFTSGATESNNIALFGVAEAYADKGDHIITCATEHKAVLDCCLELERRGKRVTYLHVDKYGLVDLNELEDSITDNTVIVSVMAANNEIGTIAPLKEIGEITRMKGVLFHTDAAQASGQLHLDVQDMNIDLMSISAHKVYGPKGVGVLYRSRSNPFVSINPMMHGGGHEKGIRSGTLNVPSIVGCGLALEIAIAEMPEYVAQCRRWTSQIIESLTSTEFMCELNGHPEVRLPNNLNVYIPGIESKAIVISLKEVAISTGSACTTLTLEPSHVIRATHGNESRAHSSIRISVGRFNTDFEINSAIIALRDVLVRLKSLNGQLC